MSQRQEVGRAGASLRTRWASYHKSQFAPCLSSKCWLFIFQAARLACKYVLNNILRDTSKVECWLGRAEQDIDEIVLWSPVEDCHFSVAKHAQRAGFRGRGAHISGTATGGSAAQRKPCRRASVHSQIFLTELYLRILWGSPVDSPNNTWSAHTLPG